MIEHLSLDLSQIEPSEVAASINRTISYSVCYENHSIHSKPLDLVTVADFLVGIKIVSHLSPDPVTVRITVSDIELCQWKMESLHRMLNFFLQRLLQVKQCSF
jgi:hypothetical protein